jgi:putative ABC transport system substrate-binding protein
VSPDPSFLSTQLESKRLGLVRELLPQASVVGLLLNLNFPDAEVAMRDVPVAARSFGLQTAIQAAGDEAQLDAAFLSFSQQRVHAVLVGVDPYFSTRLAQIISLADRYSLPTMFWRSEFARAGGLISYGTDVFEAYRQMGEYAARILKGDRPADLPFIQSSKFELVINLKSAKRLGITVPQTLLMAADEVIE